MELVRLASEWQENRLIICRLPSCARAWQERTHNADKWHENRVIIYRLPPCARSLQELARAASKWYQDRVIICQLQFSIASDASWIFYLINHGFGFPKSKKLGNPTPKAAHCHAPEKID